MIRFLALSAILLAAPSAAYAQSQNWLPEDGASVTRIVVELDTTVNALREITAGGDTVTWVDVLDHEDSTIVYDTVSPVVDTVAIQVSLVRFPPDSTWFLTLGRYKEDPTLQEWEWQEKLEEEIVHIPSEAHLLSLDGTFVDYSLVILEGKRRYIVWLHFKRQEGRGIHFR